MAQSSVITLIGKKSRATYVPVSTGTADGVFLRTISGQLYELQYNGPLCAENCQVYADATDSTTALNAALALASVKEISFNNPKGGSYVINGSVNVPYGKRLIFESGNLLTGTGTITFDQSLPVAGKYPVFDTALNVRMNMGRISQIEVFPEWWGAKSLFQPEKVLTAANLAANGDIDSTAAFKKMFATIYAYSFFNEAGRVPFTVKLSGVYALSDQIDLNYFYGSIVGHSPNGRSGGGFRWITHANTNSSKVMFKCNGCESMEWNNLSFWGYRDDNESFQLKAVIFPVFDTSVIPNSTQRRHRFINVTIGDDVGFYSNASPEEAAISAIYFAKAGVLVEGYTAPYGNGNNDFFTFDNCRFYNVQIGYHNRQEQAVGWTFFHCQAGRVKWAMQFEYGGGVTVNEFFLEGYAVENGFLNLVGGSDYYFSGQFDKVGMEDIYGTHFVRAYSPCNLRFSDCSISFYRNVGDMRPIYILEQNAAGSANSISFEGGSFNNVRGFYGSTVEPSAFMQISFAQDIYQTSNISLTNQMEGTGFSNLYLVRPIGNTILTLNIYAFIRYGEGSTYGFKPVRRVIRSIDEVWDNYPSNKIPLGDFIKDGAVQDQHQQNTKYFVRGELGKSPGLKDSVDSFSYITAATDPVLTINNFLPPFKTVSGVGVSTEDAMFTLSQDRTNSSAYLAVGDRYDKFRWGLKPVGANTLNFSVEREKAPYLTNVIYEQAEALYLSAFSVGPTCSLSGNVLTASAAWFTSADVGTVFQFYEGSLKGLKMSVTGFTDSTHVTVSALPYSNTVAAVVIQQLNFNTNKALVLTLYTSQGNYSEKLVGGRYTYFNQLPQVT